METKLQTKIAHPYIEKVEGICSGKAIIKGTRIKVSQIAVEHIDMKMDIDEIIKSHPHLHYWEIYDALSYYYENQIEIDEELVDEMKFVQKMISNNPSKIKGAIPSNAY
jgi:uncharacterized protein (DUF433 family)